MPDSSPTLRRRRLGHALRRYRVEAKISGERAGAEVERTGSWISRLEAGRVGLRLLDLRQLLNLYGVTEPERRTQLEEWAQAGQKRGWWSGFADAIPESYALFIGLEAEATHQFNYTNSVVPGLLQTEDYCRATILQGLASAEDTDPQILEKRVEVRMRRQSMLQSERPLRVNAILDESVLHRSIGGKAVLWTQLGYLIELSDSPFIDIRVLPFTHSDRAILVTAFTILRFAEDEDIVYVETATGGVYEDEKDLQLYNDIYQQLEEASLDPEASVAALNRAQEELT